MRFVTCRLPDGVEDPAIISADGTQVWPLSWLGLSYETLSDCRRAPPTISAEGFLESIRSV